MQHQRHYTLEEANAALPRVLQLLDVLRLARRQLGDRAARETLTDVAPTNGGGAPGRVVSKGFLALREAMLELRDRQIVVRDLDRGLVDFPALRNGQEVYLCWEEGEQEVGFWHDLDSGFGGRRPLSDG